MQRSDAPKQQATPSEVGALTEAEREAVHVIVCGHDEPGRTKCPGGALCCCEEVIAHMLATVSRIKDEAVQAERERIAREIANVASGTGLIGKEHAILIARGES